MKAATPTALILSKCTLAAATLLAAACGTLASAPAAAQARLAGVFGDHMVLQRHMPIRVWGWAAPGEAVAVAFRGQQRRTVAGVDGRWQLDLPPSPAGGPFELTVQASNRIVLRDVLVGELWLASGQSNMEWALKDAQDGAQEVAAATHPLIRHTKLPKRALLRPADDLPPLVWQSSSPATAGDFSAVATFFARRLSHSLGGVPVGIVNNAWGGSHLETWASPQAALADADMAPYVRALPADATALAGQRRARMATRVQAWQAGVPIEETGPAAGAGPAVDDSRWPTLQAPGIWEEQGLAGVDGVVWLRRSVTLSAAQAAGPATLHLGMVDDCETSFVNGQPVGGLCGWDTPRQWPVPAGMLHEGVNVIAVRVVDTGGGGGLHGPAAVPRLATVAGDVPLAGPWKGRVVALPDSTTVGHNEAPTLLFNGMLHPLLNLRLRGVIWYQGESNVDRAAAYAGAFQRLITDWRAQFGQPAMPFYWVQLAAFLPVERNTLVASPWAELRDAQRQALVLPHTGMVVATDVGDAHDIHPRRKKPVGDRLAALALQGVHGHRLQAGGPVLQEARAQAQGMQLRFASTGGRLQARGGGALQGFAIAGADGRFVPAQARVQGQHQVLVWSPAVPTPVAVRYGWVDNPEHANLVGGTGLPASPLRTDTWPLATQAGRFRP
jgi:sialate O-acetylesterase